MKKSLLILTASLFAVSSWADDHFTATQFQKRQPQPRSAAIQQPHGEGSIQWAAKLRNPGQAISVLAPVEYGDGSAFVDYYYEYDPSQHTVPGQAHGKGIKFLGFTF